MSGNLKVQIGKKILGWRNFSYQYYRYRKGTAPGTVQSTVPSVADTECLSQIRIFDPGSRIRIKEFKYFNPKIVFQLSENMIRIVYPGSRSATLTVPTTGTWCQLFPCHS
jgi:hypothetical protein